MVLDIARNLFLKVNQTKVKQCLILGTNVLIYAWNEFDRVNLLNQLLKNGTIDITMLSVIKEIIDNNEVRLQHEK